MLYAYGILGATPTHFKWSVDLEPVLVYYLIMDGQVMDDQEG